MEKKEKMLLVLVLTSLVILVGIFICVNAVIEYVEQKRVTEDAHNEAVEHFNQSMSMILDSIGELIANPKRCR